MESTTMERRSTLPDTHMYVLVDESGSMHRQTRSLLGGLNELFQKQKKMGGPCWVSLFFFNEEVREVFRNKKLEEIPLLTEEDYHPDCMTALRDAMGHVLEVVAEDAASRKEEDLVLLVILTDGDENASMVVSSEELARKLDEFKGQVTYMGSNQDAILNGGRAGASRDSSLQYDDDHLWLALDSLGNAVARIRSGDTDVVRFTDIERGRSCGTSSGSSRGIDV